MSKGPVHPDYVPRSWQGSRVRASASVFTEAMMPELSPHSSIASPSHHVPSTLTFRLLAFSKAF
jgi:hypothetical protein